MSKAQSGLSSRSSVVLEMIAAGSTYEQILAAYPDLTYLDIFHAAEQALALSSGAHGQPAYNIAEKRERYPRAYEKWTDEEDGTLRELVRSGETVAQIAGRLQRNRGAIRSRIVKLNLINDLTPKEQERLRRIIARDGEMPRG